MKPERPVEKWQELTPSEILVLRLLAQGETTQGIADRLCFGMRAVRFHMGNLAAKANIQRGHGQRGCNAILAHYCEIKIKEPYRKARLR